MEAIIFLTSYISWLLIIIPVGASAMITYQATRKSFTRDEGVISDCNTKIKNTLIGSAIGMSLSGLVTVFKSFYM